jgi:hypothetical protein
MQKRCDKTGKLKYKSKVSTERFLRALKRKGIIVPRNANAYYCDHCNGWHTGHNRRSNLNVK